jgi:hypothetical protein
MAEADGNRTRRDCVAALPIGFEVRARHQRGERFREDSTASAKAQTGLDPSSLVVGRRNRAASLEICSARLRLRRAIAI